MPTTAPLVSIGLPVRNGARFLADAVQSVLAQDHVDLELVISDNASNDSTEQICREFARSDSRVRYYRQATNIGLLNNFCRVLELSVGTYFKWIGDDDWLSPEYVSRCVQVLVKDPSLVLVTTQQSHVRADGSFETAAYDGRRLRSAQPLERFQEMLRLLNQSHLLLDPLYGLARRTSIAGMPRKNMLREDETFAARLALKGPFSHLAEVLSYRRIRPLARMSQIAASLGVPAWQVRVVNVLQCRALLRYLRDAELSAAERRQGYSAVAKLYIRRHYRTSVRRVGKLLALAGLRRP